MDKSRAWLFQNISYLPVLDHALPPTLPLLLLFFMIVSQSSTRFGIFKILEDSGIS
jgi:hypothetical protein